MKKYVCLTVSYLFFLSQAFGLETHEKLWVGINSQHTLSADKKWLSFIYSQLRTTNDNHPLKAALLEGGLGYRLFDAHTIWLGYRWTAHNPYNDFSQENRLFEQWIYLNDHIQPYQFISRMRLEEIQRSHESPIIWRFRQRLAVEIRKATFSKMFPFIYDEIFFLFNHAPYTTNTFFSENRLFLGFNLLKTKTTWWEIGYINQFQMRTPQQNQNQMSHILSITYNLI